MILRLAALLLLIAFPLRAEQPITEVTSPGGIKAWLVEAHDIPFVAVELRFRGGTSLDPEGKDGVVNLMTALLEEGAGDLDARDFAIARDTLAASFRFSANRDSVAVSVRALTENRAEAMALLRLALVAPRFDQDAVERVRGQVLSGLRADARDPQSIASRLFDSIAFGKHPYARPGDGTAETVDALTRDDIVAAHSATISRDRVFVSAVGDIDAAALGALLDEVLGDLPETGAPMPAAASVSLSSGVTVEDFPGPQSVVVFGHEGIARDDPDFLIAAVVNEVMGGGRFSTRLMSEVRGRRGLTYGIYSALEAGEHAALLSGRVATANATVPETIAVIRSEWERMAREGLSAEELDAIKTYMTGAYPLRFDGNAQIARILVGMQMQGFDAGYPARRNTLVNAITLDEANRVARRLFRPEDLHFVVVGSPEGLEG